MNVIKLVKFEWLWNQIPLIIGGNKPLNDKIKQALHVAASMLAIFGVPELLNGYFDKHKLVYQIVVAVVALLAHAAPSVISVNPSAVTKAGLGALILALLFGAVPVKAQTLPNAPTPAITVSVDAAPVALYAGGSWGAASLTKQRIPLFSYGTGGTSKVFVGAYQLIQTGTGPQQYGGYVSVAPDISKLIAKTDIPAGTVGVFGGVGAGVSELSAGTSSSFLVDAGVKYRLTPTVSWTTVQAGYNRCGSTNGFYISSGLIAAFGAK